VTPYYQDNPNEFKSVNIASEEVFDNPKYINRSDIRLTLDEAADYLLLKRIYDEIEYSEIINIREVIDYVDSEELADLNEAVQQKKA
jgi:Spore coat polysaccharide biosynthesis protein F, CMP-KDO synthetase homolog